MSPRLVVSWILAPLLVIGAALSGGYWVSARAGDARSGLTSALDSLPADTLVAGFTDWSAIRQRLDLGDASTSAGRAALNDDAALRDLSTRSAIGRNVEEMHSLFGWSAADVEWEVFGQAADGAAMVARFGDSVSLSDVRAALRKLKYRLDDGVWSSTSATPTTGELSATLKAVSIVPGKRLVVVGDRDTYVRSVLEVIDRDQESLLSVRSAAQVASSLAGTDSALLQSGTIACASTSFTQQPADVRAQAAAAVARAGDLAKPTFAGRGLTDVSTDEQEVRFVWGFGSPTRAREQLRVRTTLARGANIGGSGQVEDSLQLTSSRVDGTTATVRFDHPTNSATYMGGTGPLLFASC
ncbi:hypothetical protein GCM10022234_10130 [Aeromicrobium panaciterrae]|uniref:hypothetical protein n=1 Tax=Aeromicrobium panaciterrae TaxID=363861 RepID=UPI0031D33071